MSELPEKTIFPLDLTKPVQTRDGHKVRILCTDARRGEETIVGLIMYANGMEALGTWKADGSYSVMLVESDSDLINVPRPKKKVKVDVAITLNTDGTYYPWSKRSSDSWGPLMTNPVASTTIEMEYEDQP